MYLALIKPIIRFHLTFYCVSTLYDCIWHFIVYKPCTILFDILLCINLVRAKLIHNKMSNEIVKGLYTIKCQLKSYKVYSQYFIVYKPCTIVFDILLCINLVRFLWHFIVYKFLIDCIIYSKLFKLQSPKLLI
jgi:hypothetical protein